MMKRHTMTSVKHMVDEVHFDSDSDLSPSSDWSRLSSSSYEVVRTQKEESPSVITSQYDCLMVHSGSERDLKMARNFKHIIEKYLQLDDGEKPRVCVYEDDEELKQIESPLQKMAEGFRRSTSIFFLMTENFVQDKWAKICKDEALILSLEDPTKKECVIPLHTKSKTDRNFEYPFGLRILRGLDLWKMLKNGKLEEVNPDTVRLSDLNDQFLKRLTNLFNQRLDQRLNREREEKAKLAVRRKEEMKMSHKQMNDKDKDIRDITKQLHNAKISATTLSDVISKTGLIVIENNGNLQVGHNNTQHIYLSSNDVEVQEDSSEEIEVIEDSDDEHE